MPKNSTQTASENWERYQYGVERGHRDYTATSAVLEGYYLGGQYDRDGRLLAGGHWNEADLEVLGEQGRPAYEFNQIMPAVNSALGYQIANRVDIAFRPRQGDATKELADVRSKVAMQIASNNDLHWRESEVFSDGMIQQRGYFECRMDFDDNMLGELRISVLDPMDVIPDPDAKSYDPAGWADVIITRWMTLDDIEGLYGKDMRKLAEESKSGSYVANSDFGDVDSDTTPRGKFGAGKGRYDSQFTVAGIVHYRIIDRQKWVRELANVAIHPSGDIRPLEGDEDPDAIAEMQRNGINVVKRTVKRVRWAVSTMDTVLHDDWSPYDRFTVVPFFPFFRRGRTRGMIDNAIGPQKALDKGISQAIHIINTTANSGWQLEENQLANMTTEQLEQQGASTGLVLERKAGTPLLTKIQPNSMPPGVEKIIELATFTLKDVTVPDAMRGTQGAEQSGIAIQSKQHAAQQGLAVPLDSLSRTRNMLARWIDYSITKYYNSERVYRITRVDPATGQDVDEEIPINKMDQATGLYFNDMTIGEYDVAITEQPMQVTFENSQFTQTMELRKAGVNLPDNVIIKHSNLSDKHEIMQQMEQQQKPPPADPMAEAKARLIDAQTRKTLAEAVNASVTGMFSGTQAAVNIASQPAVAPLADALLKSAGFVDMDLAPIIPSVPAGIPVIPPDQDNIPSNTSPNFPPRIGTPDAGMNTGIEGGQA
ncbi:hypothetical protein [Propionivibrio sp.]|uniref:portal protein n=1 Tax=Propionivibrio sp. TaxID=2212460 RepID=UPI003BF22A22